MDAEQRSQANTQPRQLFMSTLTAADAMADGPGSRSGDPLLAAAEAGWGTTLRFALLLAMRRLAIVPAAWIAVELAQRIGWS